MTYQHLSQNERYQIYILIKDGKTQTQIAKLMEATPIWVLKNKAARYFMGFWLVYSFNNFNLIPIR
jgi:hypothetical protein